MGAFFSKNNNNMIVSSSEKQKEIAYYALHKKIKESNTPFEFTWCLQGAELFLQVFKDKDNYVALVNQISAAYEKCTQH